MVDKLTIAQAEEMALDLLLPMTNRHGFIAGATGTGKTVTLQRLAEQFSLAGVPVFMADIKGDLSGLGQAGGGNAKVELRAKELGISPIGYAGFPVVFWDVFGKKGHPLRATITDMGPLLPAPIQGFNQLRNKYRRSATRFPQN